MQPGDTLQPERPKCSAVPFEASRERVQGADIPNFLHFGPSSEKNSRLDLRKF
jgi:hypothetical protein